MDHHKKQLCSTNRIKHVIVYNLFIFCKNAISGYIIHNTIDHTWVSLLHSTRSTKECSSYLVAFHLTRRCYSDLQAMHGNRDKHVYDLLKYYP